MLSNKEILDIQSKIGYSFKDVNLLKVAFMHSSVANQIGSESNERLEFLGDSILNFVTTEFLYNNFNQSEGFLSKAKAYLVSAKYLSKFIKSINVINYLHCKTFNPSYSQNVMGDLFEAILGAIYMDCLDINVCKKYVIEKLNFNEQTLQHIYDEMEDFKSKLQELIQKNPKSKLEYKLLSKTGLAHCPNFEVGLFINDELFYKSIASNKKIAENECAKYAYLKLSNAKQ